MTTSTSSRPVMESINANAKSYYDNTILKMSDDDVSINNCFDTRQYLEILIYSNNFYSIDFQ
jgi:hypothetical protein